ncbi:hypothetical protein ATJ88_2038 [Isoptericola jiangsuensis]|uniref:Uncharacterized protein n=1 Tax=Isoptericola jiangsuensis TaxID=548579 RepID=A0A2A9EYH7_9MICO|nr:hypothetical protein ATJ88_2038 [Isoptericola jiangsuensis]
MGYFSSWDDLMDSMVWITLLSTADERLTVNQGSGKFCMTTPVQFYVGDAMVGTMDPRIVLSENNMLVITAIPGGGC